MLSSEARALVQVVDNGNYTVERHCGRDGCDFSTMSRDLYWSHRLDHEQAEGW